MSLYRGSTNNVKNEHECRTCRIAATVAASQTVKSSKPCGGRSTKSADMPLYARPQIAMSQCCVVVSA